MNHTEFTQQVTEKTIELTGKRHCSGCRTLRSVVGGRLFTMANGRKRWVCAQCASYYDRRKK